MRRRSGRIGEWIGAISIGDLVEFDIDPQAVRFEYEVLEGLLVGQSAAGELDPVPGASSHLITVVDDGDWEFLATNDEDYVELRGARKTLSSPDEKIPLAFNKPWTGFVSGGTKQEPGFGILSPDGIFILAGENEQANLPGETPGWMGVAIRK